MTMERVYEVYFAVVGVAARITVTVKAQNRNEAIQTARNALTGAQLRGCVPIKHT